MLSVSLLKLIDKIVARSLCSLLSRPKFKGHKNIVSVLVVRPGGIGDAVLLAPAVRLLKEVCPLISITILAEKRNAGVFTLINGVDEVLCYDLPLELYKAIRGQYDVVVDTEQWHRLSAVVARLVRAPIKIGFDTNERQRMFTHRVSYDFGTHETDNFMALLKPLIVDFKRDEGSVTLSLPFEALSKARQLLQPLFSESFVVIFSGASIEEKRWGAENFRQVAHRLTEDGWRVVTVGGREESVDGDRIAGDMGLNLAGKTTLAETAAIIASSSLVISGDSGVLHLAAGLCIPTVSLFGPSSETKWAPQGERHIVINHHLSCSPCSKFGTIPPCPINSFCLRDIKPDEVMESIGRLLSQPPNK